MIEGPKDLTEFVVKNGATKDDVQRIIDEAVPYAAEFHPANGAVVNGTKEHAERNGASATRPARKPISERIVDLADVEAPGELPLLFGQYLLKGSAHWLTGVTGIGKSTLLFNVSCALAEGTALWGIDCQQTRVLYVDMETGDAVRAYKVERLYSGSPRVRGHLLFLREPVKLPEELDDLLAYVQSAEIELVIFDTVRRCFSVKDENDNAEVYNRVIPTLDALKQIGVASLTLGHPSKNGNGSARGAGAQEDAGDVNLSLTMHNGADVNDSNGVIALRVTKNRVLGLGIPPLLLRRVGEDQFEVVSEEAAHPSTEESPVVKPLGKVAQCQNKVVDLLQSLAQKSSDGVPQSIIIQCLVGDFTSATIKRAVGELQKAGRIEHDMSHGYVLTGGAAPTGSKVQVHASPKQDVDLDFGPGQEDDDANDPFARTEEDYGHGK